MIIPDKALGKLKAQQSVTSEKNGAVQLPFETAQRRSIEMLRLHSPSGELLPSEPFHSFACLGGSRQANIIDARWRLPDRPHERPLQSQPIPIFERMNFAFDHELIARLHDALEAGIVNTGKIKRLFLRTLRECGKAQ